MIQTRLLFDILAEHNISIEDVKQRFGVEKMAELYDKLLCILSILDDDETIVRKLGNESD